MGKRVLFTKKEIAKYSKTHDGRQYMNSKHKKSGIVAIIFGSILFIFAIIFSSTMNNLVPSLFFYVALLPIYLLGWGGYHFFVYSIKYKEEEAAEELREKQRIEELHIQQQEKKRIEQERLARIENLKKAPFSQIDTMNGFEFEEYCTAILNDLGYNSQQTKKSGDFGADIILEKDNTQIIVQTKRYAQKVSVSAVQEITAAQNYYNIHHAWIITNNYFTKSAKELAKANNIRLVDRDELAKMINQAPTNIIIPTKEENSIPKALKNQYDPLKYNLWFCNQIQIKKEIAFDFYNQQDSLSIYNVALEAKNIPIKEKQNLIALHFFYIDIVKWLHSLASYTLEADDLALKICEADFEIFPKLAFEKATSCPTATIFCIILIHKQEYEKALEYCDFFLQHNINETNGKNFDGRKLRLQKLISKN